MKANSSLNLEWPFFWGGGVLCDIPRANIFFLHGGGFKQWTPTSNYLKCCSLGKKMFLFNLDYGSLSQIKVSQRGRDWSSIFIFACKQDIWCLKRLRVFHAALPFHVLGSAVYPPSLGRRTRRPWIILSIATGISTQKRLSKCRTKQKTLFPDFSSRKRGAETLDLGTDKPLGLSQKTYSHLR